jgi:DnaJ-class molecular chaperone
MTDKDYYGILEVQPDADRDEIRRAFRKKALQFHPDRNKDPDAVERMGEVNEAYAVLSDPEKRRNYDGMKRRFGSSAQDRFRERYSREDIFNGSDIQDVFEELSRMFGVRGFEDMFNARNGPLYRSFQYRRPGMSARGFVFFSSHGMGGKTCNHFFPRGNAGEFLAEGFRRKLGIFAPRKGKDRHDRIVISSELARKGGKVQYHCRLNDKTLLVTIPPGIKNGGALRLRGMGNPGKKGGEPGDLYVTVKIRPPMLQWLKNTAGRLVKK